MKNKNAPQKNLSDKEILEQLDLLIEFAPPQSLKRTVTELFMKYVLDNQLFLPSDFKTIASDIYYLLHFIESLEQEVEQE